MGADHTAFGTTEDAAIEGAAFEGASLEAVVTSVTAATVFCAFYDESGRMLSLASLPISAGRSQSLRFAAGDPACFEARVFVLGEEQAPLCAGRRAER